MKAAPSAISHERVEIDGRYFLRLIIPRDPDASDVRMIVETTSDLSVPGSWTSDDHVIETDEPALWVVRDTLGGPRRFMRVQVER